VFLDYLQKHPVYILNIQFFQYWNLFFISIGHAIIGGVLFVYFRKKFKDLQRGALMIVPGVILVGLTYIFALNRGTEDTATLNEILFILFNYFLVGFQGAGIMIIVMLAFMLGIFKLLYWFTLGPLLVACLVLGYKNNLRFLKSISIL